MQINGNFIKEQFKKIQEKYKLEITLEDEYRIEYQNKKIRIYFHPKNVPKHFQMNKEQTY